MQIHKKNMLILLMLLCIFLSPSYVSGHVNDKINFIEMKIELKENGNAIITETWDVNSMERFSYYKLYKNAKKDEIINFSVIDEKDMVYEFLEDWDIYMPNEEKKQRCGINYTEEGAELCWGVQNDGFHSYTINYEVINFDIEKYNYIDERINSSSF